MQFAIAILAVKNELADLRGTRSMMVILLDPTRKH